ncbi:hypothetical protein ACR0ST_03225 [Aliidiomarina sp. Khilg15.8]
MGFWARLFGIESSTGEKDKAEEPQVKKDVKEQKLSDSDQPRVVKDGDQTKRGSKLDEDELAAKHDPNRESYEHTERPKEEDTAGAAKKKQD